MPRNLLIPVLVFCVCVCFGVKAQEIHKDRKIKLGPEYFLDRDIYNQVDNIGAYLEYKILDYLGISNSIAWLRYESFFQKCFHSISYKIGVIFYPFSNRKANFEIGVQPYIVLSKFEDHLDVIMLDYEYKKGKKLPYFDTKFLFGLGYNFSNGLNIGLGAALFRPTIVFDFYKPKKKPREKDTYDWFISFFIKYDFLRLVHSN